jgi:hypothetical protein
MTLLRIRILGYYVCECGRANGLARWPTICGECMAETRLIGSKGQWDGRFMLTIHGPARPDFEWYPTTEWFPGRGWDPAW